MHLGNPLPTLLGILMMACFCGLLARRFAVLDDVTSAHAKTLSLDGLRGILASSVFFHHAYISYLYFRTGEWIPPASRFYAQLGPTAVTMFFFISGFLFWRKMLRDPIHVGTRRLIPNRARRILPAYLLAIFMLFVMVAFMSNFQLRQPIHTVAEETLFWLLCGLPFLAGPITNGFISMPLTGGIYWTLALEWIFYFLLPLLAWFRPLRRFLLCVLLAVVASFALTFVHVTNPYLDNLHYTLQRFVHMFYAGFAIGMLAAYGLPSERVNHFLQSRWMTIVGIVLIATQMFFVPANYTFQEPLLVAPIFFMVVAGNSFFGLLTSRAFRALGAVSYSLYVLHGLLLHMLVTLLNHFHPIVAMDPLAYWGYMLVAGLMITFCAILSYRFVEKPFFARRPA